MRVHDKKVSYDDKLRTEFLSEALEIVEKPISPLGHFTVIIILLIVAAFICWACFGKMDDVVTASASIAPKDGLQIVQPLYEGVVKEIMVSEGDKVSKGQPLMLLDGVKSEINIDSINDKLSSLRYKNSLLMTLSEGKDISQNTFADNNEKQMLDMMSAMQMEYKTQYEQYNLQTEQYKKQLEAEQGSLEKLIKSKELLCAQKTQLLEYQSNTPESKIYEQYTAESERLKKELDEYEQLYISGAITKYQLDEKKKEYDNSLEMADIQEIKASQENDGNSYELSNVNKEIDLIEKDIETQKKIVDKQAELWEQSKKSVSGCEYQFRQNVSDMIVQNNSEISDLESQLMLQNEYSSANILSSPVDGTVQAITVTTNGGVVTAAQSVVAIVPDDSELIAEAEVLNKDIGFIYTGQEVSLKVDAFSFQKYGTINGKIIYISPTAVENEYKGPVYKVKIAIDTTEFNVNGKSMPIASGMSGTAEIKLKSKPIIEFFFEPIFEHFGE